jgi:hypothetical protein
MPHDVNSLPTYASALPSRSPPIPHAAKPSLSPTPTLPKLPLPHLHAAEAPPSPTSPQATPESLGTVLRDIHGYPSCEVESRVAAVEFLFPERPSWPAFAERCCCRDRFPTVPSLANRTELWTCEDKQVRGGGASGEEGKD